MSLTSLALAKNTGEHRKPRPNQVAQVREKFAQWLPRLEWLMVGAITVATVSLHVRFVTHVGALWRDEANSVYLATLPNFRAMWRSLEFDSFPILFFGLVRTWSGVFGSDNDAALRALGLVIGFAVLAALWLNAHTLGARIPVLSFALIGLNPMLIRYGDSTRAYGLGIFLMLVTFWSFRRLVQSPPTGAKILLAGALAVLSVQCLYYNSVLLLAICAGAIAVATRDRAWRTVAIILTIGGVAAASLVPYLPIIQRMHAWTFLVSYPITLPWLWLRVCEVIGSPDPLGVWIWTGAFAIGLLVVACSSLYRALPSSILFAAVTCAVAVPLYAVFLRVLGYYTQPWYYITLTILVACSLDIIFGGSWDSPLTLFLRSSRILAAFVLLSIATLPSWEEITIRHTNVDVVSTKLRQEATTDDLIVTTHWQYAVSLSRYYRGPAQIVTLPPIEDYRLHRYDLALQQMRKPEPLQPVYDRLKAVLQSGHRAFFVGALPYPKAGVPAPTVSLGYRDAKGNWHGGNYDAVWPILAGYFVRDHATTCSQIATPIPDRGRAQRHERLPLSVAEGWR